MTSVNKFNDFLTQQVNLTCHESGNRKYHSTETLSLLVTGHIFKTMDKKEITAMVLIDLSCKRVSMGLTERRKTAKNLVDSRKNLKILTVSRK